jgi:DnaJ-class molecular chaperone
MAARYSDYYKTLGVRRSATADEIHDAFRRLARKFHPDVNPGNKKAEEKFKAVTEAYEILSDSGKRRRYDMFGSEWKAGPVKAESPDEGRGGFGGFFGSLFGRSPKAAHAPEEASRRSSDIKADVTITLEQAFRGGSTAVALRIPDPHAGGAARLTTRKYDIKIPPGIRDGAQIRLAGQGRPSGEKRASPGDLYIRVHIAPHPVFRLRGGDIEIDLAVSPWEAALGAKITVPALDGSVEMTLPAGSPSGQRLRLRGRGMPLANGGRGDQLVVLKIVVPETLSARERELFEQLARDSSFNPRP